MSLKICPPLSGHPALKTNSEPIASHPMIGPPFKQGRRTSTVGRHPDGRRAPSPSISTTFTEKYKAKWVAYATYYTVAAIDGRNLPLYHSSRDRRCPAEAKPPWRTFHTDVRLATYKLRYARIGARSPAFKAQDVWRVNTTPVPACGWSCHTQRNGN